MAGTVAPSDNPGFSRFDLDETAQSIPARFAKQVARFGSHPAVCYVGDELSYQELADRAAHLARALLAGRGADPEPVVLLFDQGTGSLVATLAVLMTGKFYVPLDPAQSPSELATIFTELAAQLILTDDTHYSSARGAAGADTKILNLDRIPDADTSSLLPEIDPDALAYVFYTTGSTGRPKGVADSHRNVLHNVMRYTNSLELGPEDRLSLLQVPSFSGAVSSQFAALLNGACVVPVNVREQTPARLAGWLERERITVYHSVPALFRSIVTATGRRYPDLRIVRLEGDRASPGDLALHRSRLEPHCLLVNGLGTTETGLVSQHFATGPERASTVPIGHPVEGMAVQILDDRQQPVPAGEVGEIAVRSRYLARGYWRRPDLTRERFRDLPDETGRLYLTGDLGRLRADGGLDHLGRVDDRFEIAGRVVDPAIVEAALLGHEAVAEAVVVQDNQDEQRLVAYLVPAGSPPAEAAELPRWLAPTLPHELIPAAFHLVPALPLNANGKVDRRRLADGGLVTVGGADAAMPTTLLQQQLDQIWQELLHLDAIGIDHDFFDLGGTSLLAMHMLDRIESRLRSRLSPSVLLEGATIRAVEGFLLGTHGWNEALVPLQPHGDRPPLYFFHGDYVGGGLYSLELARQLGSDQPLLLLPPLGLDGSPIPSSYQEMATRHLETLRAHRPHGPYHLGGHCNGGLVALEVARLLHQQGEQVERLILVAASAANLRFRQLHGAIRATGQVAMGRGAGDEIFRQLRALAITLEPLSPRQRAAYLARHAARVPSVLQRVFRHLPSEARRKSEPPARTTWAEGLREAYLDLDRFYFPAPLPVPLELMWPHEDPETAAEALAWWRWVSPEVDLTVIPGTHISCQLQHIDGFAAALRASLER